ncbi:MAG: serine/threonine-protein kinase [Vicinamibacteria bacterium]
MSAPLPKRLGRYEIQDEIGRGMMGVVYRALDPALGRTVALKTVQLAWAISDEDRRTFEKRFMAEARTAAGLSHPGIVVVHDIGHDPEAKTVFIAMEYLHGKTLAEMTAGGPPVEWREALRITGRVAEALHHAHEAGIVHRDVKPANIMVLPSGDPKIMDFGIAKVPTSQLTTVGEFFGTPSYMSPEQAAGGVVDGRSDVFSLGSVLYLLLTGRRAFDAPSVPAILARISSQDPPPPSRVSPGLPGDVDYVVGRALAKAPKDRYPSANAFAEDLVDVREGRAPRHRAGWAEPPRAEGTLDVSVAAVVEPETADLWRRDGAPTPRGMGTSPSRRRRQGWLAAGGVALVASLSAFFYFGDRPVSPDAARPAASPTEFPSTEAASATPAPDESPAATSGLHLPFSLPFLPTPVPPGRLEITLDHPLKSGFLRVWIDDALVAEKPLESHVTHKVLVYKSRKGHLKEVLQVTPGEHAVRVRIDGDGFDESRRVHGEFKSGQTARLGLDVGGILTRDLEVSWSP